MQHLSAIAALALILAGCSQQPAAAPEGDAAAPAGSGTPAATPPDQPGPAAAQAAEAARRIPARFIGVWDDATTDCARGSELRLEIAPGAITFYEGFGRVTGVEEDGEDVIVTLAMQGEGETWTNVERLSLVNAGGAILLHTGDGTKPRERDRSPRRKCD